MLLKKLLEGGIHRHITMDKQYFGIIYKATFPNEKCYIGQTSRSLSSRKADHIKSKGKENVAFHNAINKYGEKNIIWETIDVANSIEELNEKESFWIQFYNSYIHAENSNGYNMTLGGNSTTGWIPSKETRRKIGESNREKMMGEKNHQYGKRGNLSPWFGRKHTQEEKDKISIANKGREKSQETKDKISKANMGKRKGIPNTEEQKKKISQTKMGHKVSEETKIKISETKKRKMHEH